MLLLLLLLNWCCYVSLVYIFHIGFRKSDILDNYNCNNYNWNNSLILTFNVNLRLVLRALIRLRNSNKHPYTNCQEC